MDWLRLYCEVTRDRRLRRVSPSTRWAWVAILVLARKSKRPGYLLIDEGDPVTAADLADEAALSEAEAAEALELFTSREMLVQRSEGLYVEGWERRQYESDSSTKRVQEHRRRKRSEGCNVSGTAPETETDTDTEETTKTDDEYPEAFLAFYDAYPRKGEKRKALRAWTARVREAGKSPNARAELQARILAAACAYAEDCRRNGTSSKYMKLAATFVGPDKPYEDYLGGESAAAQPAGSDESAKLVERFGYKPEPHV